MSTKVNFSSVTSHSDPLIVNLMNEIGHLPEFCYYDYVSSPKYLNLTNELLVQRNGFDKNNNCFYFKEEKWTYEDLDSISSKIAFLLTENYNLQSGNRVLISGFNTPMLIACWFAVIRAGGICVTVMPMLKAAEIDYIIHDASITHALYDEQLVKELEKIDKKQKLSCFLSFDSEIDGHFAKSIDRKNVKFVPHKTYSTDPAIIAYTSGTTGKPKGTIHTHGNLFAICNLFPRQVLKLNEYDVCLGSPSISFTFGLGGLMLFPMRYGASTILLSEITAQSLCETISKYRVTTFYTVPTMYQRMLAIIEQFDISSVRNWVSAGEHLPITLAENWKEKTKLHFINGIGSTEMLHIFAANVNNNAPIGSIGEAINGYKISILGKNGSETSVGKPGYLAVKGPTGCRYLNNDKAQKNYVKNGWNLTGDLCLKDANGYFWYHSRSDDMIISSGYNISGLEVEEALKCHPKIFDCAVIGTPDSKRGQIVTAFVVLRREVSASKELITELQNFVKNKIAPYKYPRLIKFIDQLPRTYNGKIQRQKLKIDLLQVEMNENV